MTLGVEPHGLPSTDADAEAENTHRPMLWPPARPLAFCGRVLRRRLGWTRRGVFVTEAGPYSPARAAIGTASPMHARRAAVQTNPRNPSFASSWPSPGATL